MSPIGSGYPTYSSPNTGQDTSRIWALCSIQTNFTRVVDWCTRSSPESHCRNTTLYTNEKAGFLLAEFLLSLKTFQAWFVGEFFPLMFLSLALTPNFLFQFCRIYHSESCVWIQMQTWWSATRFDESGFACHISSGSTWNLASQHSTPSCVFLLCKVHFFYLYCQCDLFLLGFLEHHFRKWQQNGML